MTRSQLRVGYLRPLGYAAVASRVPFSLFNQSFVLILIFKMTSVESEPKTPTYVVVTNPSETFFSSNFWNVSQRRKKNSEMTPNFFSEEDFFGASKFGLERFFGFVILKPKNAPRLRKGSSAELPRGLKPRFVGSIN